MVATRRAAAGAALLLWAVGMAAMAHRQRSTHGIDQQLTEAATRLAPATIYYTVERDGRQIGFASSNLDTTATGIAFTDYMLAERHDSGANRVAMTYRADLTRTLALRHIDVASDTGAGWFRGSADLTPDSTLLIRTLTPYATRHTTHVDNAPLAPDVVPLAFVFGARPSVGTRAQYRVLDAANGRSPDVTVSATAESLFVVPDSAAFDPVAHRWRAATTDTVRAWRVVSDIPALAAVPSIAAWVDGTGRIVAADAEIAGVGRVVVRRTTYEIAYRNWTGRRLR